jgi:exonuclease III
LSELGWVDAWRRFHPGETEWTWGSNHGNGFRVDHAFASPALADRLRGCRYSHAERQAKVSDHSMVLVEVG